MVGSTAGLVALGVALTVFAGPLFSLSEQAAEQMFKRTPYIEAVLGTEDDPIETVKGGTP